MNIFESLYDLCIMPVCIYCGLLNLRLTDKILKIICIFISIYFELLSTILVMLMVNDSDVDVFDHISNRTVPRFSFDAHIFYDNKFHMLHIAILSILGMETKHHPIGDKFRK